MSAPSSCCNPCEPTTVVEVPGVQGATGAAGTNGTDGVNAFTVTTGNFTVPAVTANVTVLVTNSSWMTVGQVVFITGAGSFSVSSKPAATSAILTYLDYATNTTTGNNIVAGAGVSPGGLQIVVASPGVLTDNSTGAATSTIAAGVGIETLSFYVNLVDLAAADLLTTLTLGFKFKILAVNFAVEKAATTAAKAVTLTTKISAVAMTGGVLALTSANCTPQGTVVAGTAVTALNTGGAAATISITGSAVTAFIEGGGWILIRVQNMDSADAIASLSSKVNTLISGLTT